MQLTCAIVDDEPFALALLEGYVRQTPFLDLQGRYASAVEAAAGLAAAPVDLLFLDIQMPGWSGMDFARTLPSRTRVVFTTAFSQYAVEGFRADALDYLLKPVAYPEFLEAARRALRWFALQRPAAAPAAGESCIYVKSDYKLLRVDTREMLYVEGLKDYVKIHLEGRPRPILSLASLKAMEEALPPADFLRVHRSFIVRKDKIRVVERNRIVFGKEHVPVGDSYKQAFLDYLQQRSL